MDTLHILKENSNINGFLGSHKFPTNTFVVRLWMGISESDGQWHGRIDHLQSLKYETFKNFKEMHNFIQKIIEHMNGEPAEENQCDG